jgi:hypothetical protein
MLDRSVLERVLSPLSVKPATIAPTSLSWPVLYGGKPDVRVALIGYLNGVYVKDHISTLKTWLAIQRHLEWAAEVLESTPIACAAAQC